MYFPQEVSSATNVAQRSYIVFLLGISTCCQAPLTSTGQTCVVANNCPATVTRQNCDGSWTFCVPRGFSGGTVIGGTKEPNNWDTEPSEEVRRQLLDALARTYPSIRDENFRVVRDIVGRRPTRKGGIRLEKEQHDERFSVIHAYGLGGRGYELSWGVAEQVARLLK